MPCLTDCVQVQKGRISLRRCGAGLTVLQAVRAYDTLTAANCHLVQACAVPRQVYGSCLGVRVVLLTLLQREVATCCNEARCIVLSYALPCSLGQVSRSASSVCHFTITAIQEYCSILNSLS